MVRKRMRAVQFSRAGGGWQHRLKQGYRRRALSQLTTSAASTRTLSRCESQCFKSPVFYYTSSAMATYAQFKHVELYKIGHGKNRVPNAPKSCIAEIFNGDTTDGGSPVKNSSSSRPRGPRDTPTRPRDTHSRLFGQSGNSSVAPMITDNIRSNIQFGDSEMNGSPSHSPKMNGSLSSTPSREGNPITGDGYKSLNGQINTVTSINGNSNILHNRVPPGGYSSGLW